MGRRAPGRPVVICRAADARRCYSPTACRDFGYCRDRNLSAGTMRDVTPELQKIWRAADNPA
jgi:hypothetical protein